MVLEPYLNWDGGKSFLSWKKKNQSSTIIKGVPVTVTYLNIEQEVRCLRECSLQVNHAPHLGTLAMKNSLERAGGS